MRTTVFRTTYLILATFLIFEGCTNDDENDDVSLDSGVQGDVNTDGDTDSDADGDADTDADNDADTDADNDADTDADNDADTDADNDADTDADNDADTDADNDSDGDADSDTDGDADSDTDGDADSDTDGDADSDTDGDVDSDTDGDTDSDTDTGNSDGDTDTDSDSDTDTDADGDTDTDTDADTDIVDPSSCPWVEPEALSGGSDVVRGDMITFNDNGNWCWYQDERAVVDVEKGKLIIGSVASGGTRNGAIEAVIYDLETGQSEGIETLHKSAELWMDDHNAPAMLVMENGDYLAIWAGHNHQNNYNSYYRIYSGGQWGPEKIFNWQQEAGANYTTTYSNTWNMTAEGRIYNFARTHDKSPNMMVSEDYGQSWSYLGQLTKSGNVGYVNGYFKYWGNGVDRIDFTGTDAHPRDAHTNLFHGYVKDKKTFNSIGEEMDGNIADQNPPAISDFTTVFKTGTTLNGINMTRAWNFDVHRYDDGTLVALLKARANDNDTDHRFIYARFDGSQWNATYLGKAGDKLYCFPAEQYKCEEDYVGLGAIHPNDPNVIYISTPFDPRDDTPFDKREIFKGVTCDEGKTFNWSAITANSTMDNLRPIVPKWDATHTALIWMRGDYITAQDIDTHVVGVITSEN